MKRLAGLISVVGLVFMVACSQSDAGITTAVKTKMAADDTVKAYQLNVDTQNHVVTLTGDVQSSAARDRAITIARATDGVRDVIDRITVSDAAATSGRLDRDGAPPSVTVDINDDAKNDLEKAATATKNGIEKGVDATANAAEKAGKATAKGAKRLGNKVKDAVTDDNPDSDRDGK